MGLVGSSSRRSCAPPRSRTVTVVSKPPTAMAYEIVGLPPVVSRVENRWELRPSATGTSVTLTCIVEPGPKPPMRVAAKAVARRIGKVNESLVADLIAAVKEAS